MKIATAISQIPQQAQPTNQPCIPNTIQQTPTKMGVPNTTNISSISTLQLNGLQPSATYNPAAATPSATSYANSTTNNSIRNANTTKISNNANGISKPTTAPTARVLARRSHPL